MRELRRSDPKKYSQKVLAKMFNVSRLIVARYAKLKTDQKESLKKEALSKLSEEEQKALAKKKRLLTWLETHRRKELEAYEKKGKKRHAERLKKSKEILNGGQEQ